MARALPRRDSRWRRRPGPALRDLPEAPAIPRRPSPPPPPPPCGGHRRSWSSLRAVRRAAGLFPAAKAVGPFRRHQSDRIAVHVPFGDHRPHLRPVFARPVHAVRIDRRRERRGPALDRVDQRQRLVEAPQLAKRVDDEIIAPRASPGPEARPPGSGPGPPRRAVRPAACARPDRLPPRSRAGAGECVNAGRPSRSRANRPGHAGPSAFRADRRDRRSEREAGPARPGCIRLGHSTGRRDRHLRNRAG